jgi:hypothetical protein
MVADVLAEVAEGATAPSIAVHAVAATQAGPAAVVLLQRRTWGLGRSSMRLMPPVASGPYSPGPGLERLREEGRRKER